MSIRTENLRAIVAVCLRRSGRSRRSLLCSLLVLSLAFGSAKQLKAQRGEDIAKSLLRALIESQLEKGKRRNPGPSTQLSPRPGSASKQMQQLRPISASFAQEATTLSALVRTDAARSFQARRRLADAMKLQAEATALRQRVASQNHHTLVLDDFRDLNNEWAVLSHELRQCSDISQNTRACMKRMDDLDARYCSLLEIQAQYDNQQLTASAYTLTTYVRDLVDDVQHCPFQDRNSHRQTMRDLGRLSEKVNYFAGLVSRGSGFDTIVNEYQTLYQTWINIEPRLVDYSGHAVARDLRRIRDAHQDIHKLLRLQIGIDRNLVLHLIHEAHHELEELYRTITLEDLLVLPESNAVPGAADAVFGTMQNIDDLVHRDESPQEIGEAWVYVSDAWNQFEFLLRSVQNPVIRTKMQDIDASISSLQQTLGVTVEYDPQAIFQSASQLESLSDRLLVAVRQWQQRPGQHDRSLQNRISAMIDIFHDIEQSANRRLNRALSLKKCDQAIEHWQRILPQLRTCETPERETFDHITATFTSEAVRLRTMLE